MSSIRRLQALAAAMVLLLGCGTSTEPVGDLGTLPTPVVPLLTTLPRPLSASEQKLVDASNSFSFSLFRQLNAAQKDSNTFTSPLSASVALAIAMSGASGRTYDQIRTALSLTSATDAEVNDGYKSLMTLLRALDATSDIRLASSVWYRSGFPVDQSFNDATTKSFDAPVSALDFASPSAAVAINAWASGATQGKIPTMVDRTDATQVMLLMNAVSFKGTWRQPFDTALTIDAAFHAVSGNQPVRMMTRGDTFRYFASDVFEAVDLPYGNGAYSMTIALPRSGKSVDAVASSIQGMGDAFWSQKIREVPMQLFLPRFRIDWDRTLNDDLEALGITDAFAPGAADFTRMSTRGHELVVNSAKQRTFVDLNEDGTEAAALVHTFAVRDSASAPPFPLIMFVDRPFMVVIREHLSGTIVFLGKVMHID